MSRPGSNLHKKCPCHKLSVFLNHCILAVNWFWLSSSVNLFILHVNLQSNFLVIVHNANLRIFGVCWPFGTQVVNSRRHGPPTCEQTSCQNRQACSCLQEKNADCLSKVFFRAKKDNFFFRTNLWSSLKWRLQRFL